MENTSIRPSSSPSVCPGRNTKEQTYRPISIKFITQKIHKAMSDVPEFRASQPSDSHILLGGGNETLFVAF